MKLRILAYRGDLFSVFISVVTEQHKQGLQSPKKLFPGGGGGGSATSAECIEPATYGQSIPEPPPSPSMLHITKLATTIS